jgi:hypothetical protein
MLDIYKYGRIKMTAVRLKVARPDNKGRVFLGHLADGVSSFVVSQDAKNRIILEPYVEIPANEKWLFANKVALDKVKKGVADSANGRLSTRGSFADYADEELD